MAATNSKSTTKGIELDEDVNVKLARIRFKNELKRLAEDGIQEEIIVGDSDSEGSTSNLTFSYKYTDEQGFTRVSFGGPSSKNRAKKPGNLCVDLPPPQQPSFRMKLFDREIDLAPFDAKAPLYPICRAWMQNEGGAVKVAKVPRPRPTVHVQDNDSEISNADPEDTDDFYRLPPPDILPYDENGVQKSLRVPPPLAQSDEKRSLLDNLDDSECSPTELFQGHLDRWNLIRQRWREAAAYNEQRYEHSFRILRQIHKTPATEFDQ